MFELKLHDVPLEEIDCSALANAAPYFSGADIDGVVDAAKELVIADIIDSGSERPMRQGDLLKALELSTATTIDWLKTARNLVKYAGADSTYREVGRYLKKVKLV